MGLVYEDVDVEPEKLLDYMLMRKKVVLARVELLADAGHEAVDVRSCDSTYMSESLVFVYFCIWIWAFGSCIWCSAMEMRQVDMDWYFSIWLETGR